MSRPGHDVRTLVVLMHGRVLGEVYRDRGGRVRLRYDSEYQASTGAIPLSASMPLTVQRHTASVVAPWLENLLPDDPLVRQRWRREFGVRDTSAFALLRHIGEDVAGAAQFVRPERVDDASAGGGLADQDEAAIAGRIDAIGQDPTAWVSDIRTGRFSLAGSQSKFALHRTDAGWAIPTGHLPTTHIFKPAMPGLEDQDIDEHLCLSAARSLGMLASMSQILDFNGRRVLVVQRYDRRVDDKGMWTRIHQEDMCQALGIGPANKYEDNGGPGAADIVSTIRRSVTTGQAVSQDVSRFIDALVFNWLVGGTDAHAKNYALLYGAAQVRLAPFYDLNSLLPYVDRLRGQRPAMRIGGDSHRPLVRIGEAEWASFASNVDMPREEVLGRVERIVVEAPAAFDTAVTDLSKSGVRSQVAERLAESVARRSKACLQALGRTAKASPGKRSGSSTRQHVLRGHSV